MMHCNSLTDSDLHSWVLNGPFWERRETDGLSKRRSFETGHLDRTVAWLSSWAVAEEPMQSYHRNAFERPSIIHGSHSLTEE